MLAGRFSAVFSHVKEREEEEERSGELPFLLSGPLVVEHVCVCISLHRVSHG